MSQQNRAHWGSRLAFILAAAGSAVGLGNIWKFPYIAGVNGGGSFVLIYLLCIAFVGVPILIAELYIGQQAQKNTVQAFEVLDKKGTPWRLPGYFGLASAFLILSFYSVVGGWIFDFLFKSVSAQFVDAPQEEIKNALGTLFGAPLTQAFWHFVFMAITISIVLGGVRGGLEKWAKRLMPALFGILIVLLVYCMSLDGFGPAISFLFSPHAGELTAAGILEAVGHSFFTLSLGMGAIITYGSYLRKGEGLMKIAIALAALDTIVALAAGVVIFSIVFSFGLEPGAGPGLIFTTLPMLFSQMNGGYVLSIIFFLLVAFAAITSAVSILEVVVAYWSEKHQMNRKKTTIAIGTVIFLVGLMTIPNFPLFSKISIFGLGFFDLFDKLSSSYFLPIGGLLIALFFGWKLSHDAVKKVIPGPTWATQGLLWSARVVAPLAVLLVLYNIVAPLLGLPGFGND